MLNTKQPALTHPYLYLVSLAGLNELLIGWLLFQPLILQAVYFFEVVFFTTLLIWLIQSLRLCYFLRPLAVILAGGLGILIGSIFDFGQLGLQALSSLCVAPSNDAGFGNISRMLSLAPWAHIGMWVSCSVALIIVDYRRGGSVIGLCSGVKHVFCLIGMLIGMWFIQLLPLNWLLLNVYFSDIGAVALMWLGMSIGMLFSYVIFDVMVGQAYLPSFFLRRIRQN